MAKYNIDITKTYNFPKDLRFIHHKGKILVVSPTTANWIVLDSLDQMQVLSVLREGHTIEYANSKHNSNDVNYVVTQIEARKLCNKQIKFSQDKDRTLHIYLTNKCNLACPHCYMFSGTAYKDELTTEEIIQLVRNYKNIAKGEHITLSGGEPTSRVDFDKIISEAKNLGIKIKVLTNGTKMSQERIKFLSKCIESIQISIDGFSEETNAPIRGKGNFKKALNAVDAFLKLGIETSIAVTPPLKHLKEHLNEYTNFAIQLSQKYYDLPFNIKFSENLINGREINPNQSYNREYYELMKEIQEQIYGPDYELMTFVRTLYDNTIINNCMFGAFSVASNGDVYFCARITDLKPIANIRTTPFEKVYEKSRCAETATMVTKLQPCKNCELLHICGGGCRIEEFPDIAKQIDFLDINMNSIPARKCDKYIKSKIYDLMLQSNEYFYTPIE